ncbi:MAG TPA: hypothetical protein VLH84_00635 [Patescibacteria group bacterium]|nr:hypothetical protein [Patescibacteria group bacterium]
MPKKICIIYGFCEGPRIAARMLTTLKNNGFEITGDPHNADVILAHSGGCYMVPHNVAAKRIIMVGLTYWPGKSITRTFAKKIWDDLTHHRSERAARFWAHKTRWNLTYFWNMPRNFAMLNALRAGDFWQLTRVTVVRNHQDHFCTPDLTCLPFAHKPRLVELPGQHDDLWLHPERYLSVIQ